MAKLITLVCDHCLNIITDCDCPVDFSDPFGLAPIPNDFIDDSEDLTFSLPIYDDGNYCIGCDEFIDELGECGCRDNVDDHYFARFTN